MIEDNSLPALAIATALKGWPVNERQTSSVWRPYLPHAMSNSKVLLASLEQDLQQAGGKWDQDRLIVEVKRLRQQGLKDAFFQEIKQLFKVAAINHSDIAERLGVTRAAVTQWFGETGISSEKFVMLLHEYRDILAPVLNPDSRRAKEREIEGIVRATWFIAWEVLGLTACRSILSRHDFVCLDLALRNKDWFAGNRHEGATQIVDALHKEYGLEVITYAQHNAPIKRIQGVIDNWGRPYTYCVFLSGLTRDTGMTT